MDAFDFFCSNGTNGSAPYVQLKYYALLMCSETSNLNFLPSEISSINC
ncbi:hypothetical protein EB08_01459 [Enterococcus cecorum]|nr:hypothetical protein EB08_01459 [Enterococcus cecorum]RBR33780.1 hypothetical protein EB26_01794 [Enterococcus cecorum]